MSWNAHTLAPETGLTSIQVSRLLGVSLRQLQWWDEHDVISVPLRRHRRVYTEVDIQDASIVLCLRKKGVSLESARKALRVVRANRDLSGGYLAMNQGGTLIRIKADGIALAEFLARAAYPMVVVKL